MEELGEGLEGQAVLHLVEHEAGAAMKSVPQILLLLERLAVLHFVEQEAGATMKLVPRILLLLERLASSIAVVSAC